MPHNTHPTLNTVTFCSDCTVALYCAVHAPGVLDYSLQFWLWPKKQFSTQFVLAVLLDFLVMRSTLVHHRFKKSCSITRSPLNWLLYPSVKYV